MAHEKGCPCYKCWEDGGERDSRDLQHPVTHEGARDCGIRLSILPDAEQAVHGDRNKQYGTPTENWTRTAKIWSVILGIEVTPEQAALCMIGTKIARQIHKPKRDNMVDIAGYAEVCQWIADDKESAP